MSPFSQDVEAVLAEVGYDRDDGELFLWPEIQPLNIDLPPVQPFKYSLLPSNIAPWVQDIAERQQCPPDFVAVAVMIALSSLIGRKLVIFPKAFDDWRVTPNLWGCAIGRSSTMKTPALSEALRPLKRLTAEAGKIHAEETENYLVDALMFTAAKAAHLGNVQKAVKSGDAKGISAAAIQPGWVFIPAWQPLPIHKCRSFFQYQDRPPPKWRRRS